MTFDQFCRDHDCTPLERARLWARLCEVRYKKALLDVLRVEHIVYPRPKHK